MARRIILILLLVFSILFSSCSSIVGNYRGISSVENKVSDLIGRIAINQEIKSIALDAAYTRAGRGDVAPALAAAKNFRKMGYTGEITVYINDSAGNSVLKELSLEYRTKADLQDTVLTIGNNIKINRNYGDFTKVRDDFPHDIGIRFALRPSEIRAANNIKDAKVSFFLGVYNLSKIPTSNQILNKVVYKGQQVFLPDVGPGKDDLGIYYNRLAHELSELNKKEKQEALINSLQNDLVSYNEYLQKNNHDYVELLKSRNEKLINYLNINDNKKTNRATIYGIGLKETWYDFGDYLKTVNEFNVKTNSSTILFGPTVFTEETATKLTNHLKEMGSITSESFEIVDLLNGGKIPEKIPPGKTVMVMTGNLPQDSYLKLLSVSKNIPNLVAGDNALGDALSLGRPFVMTRVEWNKPSMENVKRYIHHLKGDNSLSEEFLNNVSTAYNPREPKHLSATKHMLDNPGDAEKLFQTIAKNIQEADVFKTVLNLGNTIIKKDNLDVVEMLKGNIGNHYNNFKLEDNAAKKLQKALDLIDYEQTRNIKEIYQKGVFDSSLPKQFSADSRAIFKVPYYLIPETNNSLERLESVNISDNIKKHYSLIIDGKKYFRFPVHPTAINYYQSVFKDAQFVDANESTIIAIPTSSDRTLLMVDSAFPDASVHMAKLSIPLEINNNQRAVWQQEIRRSIYMTNIIEQSDIKNKGKMGFVFPETYGCFPKKDKNLGGFIVREIPSKFYDKSNRYVPMFSFLSTESSTQKPLFFRYMSKHDKQMPYKWLKKNIIDNINNIIDEWHVKKGITFEMHSQNLLIQINEQDRKLTGKFAYRDLGGAIFDIVQRTSRGLDISLDKIILDDLKTKLSMNQSFVSVRDFYKKQIVDLFIIQMASHGLITREERELMKKQADVNIRQHLQRSLLGDRAPPTLLSWDEIGELSIKNKIQSMIADKQHYAVEKYNVLIHTSPDLFDNQAKPFYVLKRKNVNNRQIKILLDKDKQIIGYTHNSFNTSYTSKKNCINVIQHFLHFN
ncbi:MAG: hypothetical protein KAQ98_10765 [Bacteriovoracaceae bacterium]|nr:hypothetical protein [Bacteriovoracaceae bacterium]